MFGVGLLALLAAPATASAQAPGGAATNLKVWLKADQGVTGASPVTAWNDQSGNGSDATTQVGSATQTLVSNGLNFNPVVRFAGNGGLDGLLNPALTSNNISAFVVVKPLTAGSWRFARVLGVHPAGQSDCCTVDRSVLFHRYPQFSTTITTHRAGYKSSVSNVFDRPGVFSTHFTSGNQNVLIYNGVPATAVASTTTPFNSNRFEIAFGVGGEFLAGDIAEIVLYTADQSAAGTNLRIDSYLALKYGITLEHDYFDSGDAMLWDRAANAPYNNNIAGIGRDDASGLTQRQSQSVNTVNSGNFVTMGLSTIAADNASNANNFTNDRSFLAWGDDGASTAFATPIVTPSAGSSTRMARIWRVQETATVGTVKVGVPAAAAPGALVYLVVSNDAVFDNGDQWLLTTPLSSGTASYLAADADFTTGQYFTFAMLPLTDLTITKSDGQAVYVPGKPVNYSIVVTNVGPTNATGVSIADMVPPAITGVTVNCTAAGTADCGTNGSSGNTVSFTGASVAAGAGHQLTITVSGTVDGSTTGNLVNAASVSAGSGQTDPNTANNIATDTDTPAQADVTITKSGPAGATPGATLTYTLTVTNNGPNLAAAVSVSDPTPTGLTFVSNAGACVTGFPCALGDLAPATTRTITSTYQLPSNYSASDPIVNTATVTSGTVDPDSTNNTSAASTPLSAAQSDLQLVKHVSAAAVLPGQTFTYTLQITNNGPSDATNVRVTDVLPPNAAFFSSAAGCTPAAQTVTCPTIPTMPVASTQAFDIVVELDPGYGGDGSDIRNSATVTSDTADPALENNANPAGAPPVGPAGADITLVKTALGGPVAPGQIFSYQLLVSNQGPSVAADVVVMDTLPAPIAFVSSGQGCTAVGQDVTCPAIATLNPGQFTTFTLVVQLESDYTGDGTDLDNVATVQTTTPDPVPDNNTTPPVRPNLSAPSADLSATKTTIDSSVTPGQTFTYQISVENAGPSVAQSVTVTDTLPAALQFVSSPQACTAAGQVVTCVQPLLSPQGSVTFTLLVRLDPAYLGTGSDLTNIATVTSPTPDPNTANNTTGPVPPPAIVPGSADLTIVKSGPIGPVPGGSEITYTLVVTNQGPNAAADVVVEDPTPSGLTFISTTGDCAMPFPCALGTILPGLSKTMSARYAVALGVTVVSNTATVSSAAPDPKLSNNSATALTPAPAQTYYFSEGATGDFFDDELLIANPHAQPAPITLNFLTQEGTTITQTGTVPAQSRLTVRVDDIPGLEQTATGAQVLSDSGLPLAVERSMFWDSTSYAGHTATAAAAPATRWYFAEGFQGYLFTYVLLENPGAAPAEATVTFLRETEAPFVKQVAVPPFTRVTVDANADPAELFGRGFGIVVDSTQPIVAERSMYFGSTDARFWSGGHSSAGVTEPAWRWFLSEGATGSFFDTWILLSNPQTVDAHVTLDYQLEDGTVVSMEKVVPARRRLTIGLDQEPDARLHNAAVSTRVSSDVPIVAERSMYWGSAPDSNPWSEGHNSFGMTESGLRWAVAEGRVGGPLNFFTYLLLANPQDVPAEVTITYLRENGAPPIVKTHTVPKTTRFTIDVRGLVPELQDESFGALVEVTNGVTISVERSMYWDANGITWAGGTNGPGTKLQ